MEKIIRIIIPIIVILFSKSVIYAADNETTFGDQSPISIEYAQKFYPEKFNKDSEPEVSLASVIEGETIDIYALPKSIQAKLDIPSEYPTSYQLEGKTFKILNEYGNPYYNNDEPISISSSGIVTVKPVRWYLLGMVSEAYGSYTTKYTPGASYQDLISFGKTIVQVDDSKYIIINIKDYSEIYATAIVDDYIKNNIPNNLSGYEKLNEIAKFCASFDYSGKFSTMETMIAYGGGDCLASTDLTIYMCKKLGITCRWRYAANDAGAGSGHRNALAKVDGKVYMIEAGYNGTAPRQYDIIEKEEGFSIIKGSNLNKKACISQYDGFEKNVVVPNYINGYEIIQIGKYAFAYGNWYEDRSYESITLPDTLKTLDIWALASIKNIKTIHLPKSLKTINKYALNDSESLETITVDNENPYYKSVNGVLYSKDGKELVAYPFGKKDEVYEVVDGTESIAAGTFKPNFMSTQNLKTIILPDSIKELKLESFWDTNIKEIYFKGDAPSLEDYVFAETYKLTIYYPTGNESWEQFDKSSTLTYADLIIWKEWKGHSIDMSEVDVSIKNTNPIEYEENGACPELEVKYKGEALELNKDYIVNYENNNKIGTATATVVPIIRNFIGSKKIDYTIVKTKKNITCELEDSFLDYKNYKLTHSGYGEPSVSTSDEEILTILEDGSFNIKNPGQVKITINYTGDENHLPETWTKEITILGHEHNISYQNKKYPTCSEEGYQGDKYCSICKKIVGKGDSIPKTEHWENSKTVKKEQEIVIENETPYIYNIYGRQYYCQICNEELEYKESRVLFCAHEEAKLTKSYVEPTYYSDGQTEEYYCYRCEMVVVASKVLPKLEHTMEEHTYEKRRLGSLAEESKCWEIEKHYTLCDDCSYENKELLTEKPGWLLMHEYIEKEEIVEPTCRKSGYTTVTVCKRCGDVKTKKDIIPYLGHDTIIINQKEATCLDGYTGDTYCKRCGEIIKEGKILYANQGHKKEIKNVIQATCQSEGYTGDTYCVNCNQLLSEGEKVSIINHKVNIQNQKEATCQTEGYSGDKVCEMCNEVIEKGKVLECVEHSNENKELIKSPTCTTEGLEQVRCVWCQKILNETILPKENHNLIIVGKKEATCTTKGYTGDKQCSMCNQIIEEGEEIKLSSHIAGNEEIITKATCTTEGLRETKCIWCQKILNETILPKEDHDIIIVGKIEATCVEEGYTGDKQCSKCNEIVEKGKKVEVKEHSAKVIPKKEATCTTDGYEEYSICSICNKPIIQKQIIDKLGHDYNEITIKATLSKSGYTAQQCSICDDIKDKIIYYYPKTISLNKKSFIYNAKVQKPYFIIKDSKGNEIDAKYYSVSVPNSKIVGAYNGKITFKGMYSGNQTIKYTIVPAKTVISKLTTTSKTMNVYWKKLTTQTTGYQIQYSTSSAFTSPKYVLISKNIILNKKITGLTKKKKYYVRIRTYKTVNSTKYYSAWSPTKYITIK